MTKPIGPGINVVCTRAVSCSCGCAKATQGAIYMCDGVGQGGILHIIFCRTEGCDGTLVELAEKEHCLCACCFAPLDDGDTSLAEGESDLDEHTIVRVPTTVLA